MAKKVNFESTSTIKRKSDKNEVIQQSLNHNMRLTFPRITDDSEIKLMFCVQSKYRTGKDH